MKFIEKAKGDFIYVGINEGEVVLKLEQGSFVVGDRDKLTAEDLEVLERLKEMSSPDRVVLDRPEFEELVLFLHTAERVVGKQAPVGICVIDRKLRLHAEKEGIEAEVEVTVGGSVRFCGVGVVETLRSRIERLRPPLSIFSCPWNEEKAIDLLVFSDQAFTVYYAVRTMAKQAVEC